MKPILKKILPEKYYTHLEIWLIEHPTAPVAGFWLFVTCIVLYFAFRPQPFRIQGYISANVKSIQDSTGDNGFSATARIELPDGTFAFTSTKSMALASDALDDICVEERELQNGLKRYRWVHKQKCD